MEGVTDAPMRALLTEVGPYLFCVTEFLRVTEQIPPRSVFKRHVPELQFQSSTPSRTPVIVQLLGGNPEKLAESASRAVALGARGIDLNFGCPAPTVNRHDGGATLLQYPRRLFEIISCVRNTVPKDISVSAKLRLGWSDPNDIFRNLEWVLKANPSWITLHARTRIQGYSKPVYWEHIGKAQALSSVPIVANGDIWSFEEFKKCQELTQCNHFMLGRGALGNPLLSQAILDSLNHPSRKLPYSKPETPEEWRPFVLRFVQLALPFSPRPEYVVRRIKQWIKMASLEKPLPWFDFLKKTETLPDCLNIFGIGPAEYSSQSLAGTLSEVLKSTPQERDTACRPTDKPGRFPEHYLQ